MNFRMIGFVIGRILLTEAALLLLPLAAALWYGERVLPFLVPILLLLVVGLLLGLHQPKRRALFARDGLAVVALAWILMSVFGSIPFVLSGDIPNVVDALFETVSGFTTTGASILADVESLSRSGLLWRSFTHWIGGMGVLVFVMAILPMTDGHGMHLMRAEVPGPSVGKLVSRMGDTAKILYGLYFVLTVILFGLLLAGGMPFYDACLNAFATAGTGGFSHLSASIGSYNNGYFDMVIAVFMMLFGINFNLYYFLLIRRFREAFGSEELRTYFLILAGATLVIAINIFGLYGSSAVSLRHAFFQVVSVMTTTGFATVDYEMWPTFSKAILGVLMFVGGCAGSTAGGLKLGRVMILVKASVADMRRMLHPNAVSVIRMEGRTVPERSVRSAQFYITVYLLVYAVSFLLLSFEPFDLTTVFSAVSATLNNIGPGFGAVGPAANFSAFSAPSKLLLTFDMLAGRLEIFPMLLLFAPSIWARRRSASR